MEPFGRCGEGPGELSGSRWLVLSGGKVYVFGGQSVNVFDEGGRLLGRHRMEVGGLEVGFLNARREIVARNTARYDQVIVTSLPKVTQVSSRESRVTYEQPAVAGAWSDGAGGCYMAVVKDQTGPPGVLRHYPGDFTSYELLRLPDDYEGSGNVIAQGGDIWILDEMGSALYRCRVPVDSRP